MFWHITDEEGHAGIVSDGFLRGTKSPRNRGEELDEFRIFFSRSNEPMYLWSICRNQIWPHEDKGYIYLLGVNLKGFEVLDDVVADRCEESCYIVAEKLSVEVVKEITRVRIDLPRIPTNPDEHLKWAAEQFMNKTKKVWEAEKTKVFGEEI